MLEILILLIGISFIALGLLPLFVCGVGCLGVVVSLFKTYSYSSRGGIDYLILFAGIVISALGFRMWWIKYRNKKNNQILADNHENI